MFSLPQIASIASAAVLVALFSPKSVDAQGFNASGTTQQSGGFLNGYITGVQYDVVNKAVAEQRLECRQAKLRHDSDRGHTAAVNHDVRRIDNLRYRIAVDGWLIRMNSLQDPGFYPMRTDPISRAAIADAARPASP